MLVTLLQGARGFHRLSVWQSFENGGSFLLAVGVFCLQQSFLRPLTALSRRKIEGQQEWGSGPERFGEILGSLRRSLRGHLWTSERSLRGPLVLENRSQNALLRGLPAPSQSAMFLSVLRILLPLIVLPLNGSATEELVRRAFRTFVSHRKRKKTSIANDKLQL